MASAQDLQKMQWFNQPDGWTLDGGTLSMDVPALTDYWRITNHGFCVDDAPFYYAQVGGDFEMKVKVSAQYRQRFDQAGIMLRVDAENWLKAGIEYVDGKYNLSVVVTHQYSDWSVTALDKPVDFIWIKAVRRGDCVTVYYSHDDQNYAMLRECWMGANRPMMAGMMGASPDGNGFTAKFEHFQIQHLPDAVRLKWLKDNQ